MKTAIIAAGPSAREHVPANVLEVYTATIAINSAALEFDHTHLAAMDVPCHGYSKMPVLDYYVLSNGNRQPNGLWHKGCRFTAPLALGWAIRQFPLGSIDVFGVDLDPDLPRLDGSTIDAKNRNRFVKEREYYNHLFEVLFPDQAERVSFIGGALAGNEHQTPTLPLS